VGGSTLATAVAVTEQGFILNVHGCLQPNIKQAADNTGGDAQESIYGRSR
jgi:hypothetical protein